MGAAAAAVGGIFSAFGQSREAAQERQATKYNADIAERNAGIALAQGDAAAIQQGKVNYTHTGAIRAAVGGSGATADSAVDVLMQTASEGKLAQQNILQRAFLKSKGFGETAHLDRMRADYLDEQASSKGMLLNFFGGGGARAWGSSASAGSGTQMPGTSSGQDLSQPDYSAGYY